MSNFGRTEKKRQGFRMKALFKRLLLPKTIIDNIESFITTICKNLHKHPQTGAGGNYFRKYRRGGYGNFEYEVYLQDGNKGNKLGRWGFPISERIVTKKPKLPGSIIIDAYGKVWKVVRRT